MRISTNHWPALVLTGVFLLTACGSQKYHAAPLSAQQSAQQSSALDHQDQAFKLFLEAHRYSIESWPLQQFDLAALTLAAMHFNPTVKLARSRIEVARAGEMIAGQRPNPILNFPDEPRDTADFYGLVVDFLFERAAKREARQAEAQAILEAAETELAQQVWSIYSELHTYFVEYYGTVLVRDLLEKQRAILQQSVQLLQHRVDAGQASDFELSRLRLELQQTDLMISNQLYKVNDTFHRLITITGLQADKFKHVDFDFSDLQQHLQAEEIEIQQLQTVLLHSRFDVMQSLAEYQAYEARLKLEIEKQYPDITLSPGLLFERGQALWVLAAAGAFPLFHNNDGQIQQALAERERKQYEFIQLQTSLLSELARRKQNYQDRLLAHRKGREYLADLESSRDEIEKQFKLGYSDKLAVLRSRLEIEKTRQTIFQIELDVMRAAVQLEAVTQSPRYEKLRKLDFTRYKQQLENKS